MKHTQDYLDAIRINDEILTRPEHMVITARTFIRGYEQALNLAFVNNRSELLIAFGMKLAESCMIKGSWELDMEEFVKDFESNL